MACKIIHSFDDPAAVATFLVGAEAIAVGDLLKLDTATMLVTKADASADDATFIGVALGSGTAGQGNSIPVALKCIVQVSATSATYKFGDAVGLHATAHNTVIAVTAGAKSIGNVWTQIVPAAATTIDVLIDVAASALVADKIFEGPAS